MHLGAEGKKVTGQSFCNEVRQLAKWQKLANVAQSTDNCVTKVAACDSVLDGFWLH
jgi:hypothetical protein